MTLITTVPLHRNRDFRNLWVGQALSEVGSRAAGLAYPLLVLALTGSPFQAGLVGALGMAAGTVLALPAGALVDRWNRRRLMIACEAARGVAMAVLGIAVVTQHASVALIAAVAIVNAAGGALFFPAQAAALRHIVPEPQLPLASARIEARSYGAEIAGAPLGGALFGVARALPFLADAVTYLASLAAVAAIRRPLQEERTDAPEGLLTSIRHGLGFVWRNAFLRAAGGLAALLNVAIGAAFFSLVLALQQHGVPPAGIGAAQTGLALSGLLGALLAPWIQPRLRAPVLIVVASWAAAGLVGVAAILAGSALLVLPLALTLLAAPALNATVFAYQIAITPDAMQGRVDNTIGMLAQGLSPLGPLLAGALIEAADARLAFAASAAILAIAATLATGSRGIRSMRSISADSEPQERGAQESGRYRSASNR